MTIHREHPFLPPEGQRDPARRFRGRLVAPVTLWLADAPGGVVGHTISSVLVALGEAPALLGLLDPDAPLADALASGSVLTVSILGEADARLADAFAGTAPAPGGAARLAETAASGWGPRLAGRSWLGARVTDVRPVGWSSLITADIEHVELVDAPVLGHVRGRYLTVAP